jgi:2-amino-4-hydroxy-6-hydroxymethyldihydropteridine diphosphokinase
VAVGLGANLGDPRASFAFALARIAGFTDGLSVSPLYRTAPVGGPPQPDYLNAAAVARTRLSPDDLLRRLAAIEREAGRTRGNGRNSPRVLDLDLLLYGRHLIARPGLRVPHPRMAERRFVLVPLADLAPRRVVPGTGKTVARLLREAPPARVERAGPLFGGARP